MNNQLAVHTSPYPDDRQKQSIFLIIRIHLNGFNDERCRQRMGQDWCESMSTRMPFDHIETQSPHESFL